MKKRILKNEAKSIILGGGELQRSRVGRKSAHPQWTVNGMVLATTTAENLMINMGLVLKRRDKSGFFAFGLPLNKNLVKS